MIPVYSYLLIYGQEIGFILQNTIIKFQAMVQVPGIPFTNMVWSIPSMDK